MNSSLPPHDPYSLGTMIDSPNSLVASTKDYPASGELCHQLLEMILSQPPTVTLLDRLAEEIGQHLEVKYCWLIAGVNFTQPVQVGFWSAYNGIKWTPELSAHCFTHPLWQTLLQSDDPVVHVPSPTGKMTLKTNEQEVSLSLSCLFRHTIYHQQKANGLLIVGIDQANFALDLNILQAVFPALSIAFNHLHLSQKAQMSDLYQTLFNDLSQGVRSNANVNTLLHLALKGTSQVLNADQGWVLLMKYHDPLYKTRQKTGLPKATLQPASYWSNQEDNKDNIPHGDFHLSESYLCQQALQNAPQPLTISSLTHFLTSEQIQPHQFFSPQQYPSLLMMPLLGNTNDPENCVILGFLILQSQQPRLWQTSELELINWVCAHLSTAIIHFRALNRVQSLVEERTAQLQWSLDVQAKLSEKMRQQIEELQRLNQLKDEFLSTISHELNTPLATMKMAISMLRQPGRTPERQAMYLDILEKEWLREKNLIQDLLTLQHLESNKFVSQAEELDIKEFFGKIIQPFKERWALDKGLTLVLEFPRKSKTKKQLPLTLYSDEESLKRIFNELLANAGKYADPETEVTISVHQENQDNGVITFLTISNYGPGISEEEQLYIFEKFRRGQGVTDKAIPGTGLGLALVKSLVQHLNGSIELSSLPTKTPDLYLTSFIIQLPHLQ